MTTASRLLQLLRQRRIAVACAAMLVLVVVMIAATVYTFDLPRFMLDRQQTLLFGPTQYSPASPASVRVVVRNQATNSPISGADVAVRLAPKAGGETLTLYTGRTDARGTVPISFTMPANLGRDQTLIVETSSPAGRDRIQKDVRVERTYKVLVTTDKPLFQPGQTIHLRALALGALDRLPAQNQAIDFLIEDPKGNKIYRKTLQSSTYGVVSSDFALADTLNAGAYKITASVGNTKSEKTVTVKPYVLPKFKVTVDTERGYYLPGERVVGNVRADYFFGKPVAKSDVTIKGIVYDVARAETVSLTGKTDAEGVYSFSFTLPNYFAGRGLDANRADFGLQVSVTDQANHTEESSLALPIASDPIIIDAVPESGKLVAGVENIVYVLTALPDGSPAECDITADGAGVPITARSGKYGLAEIRFTPTNNDVRLSINARDAKGRSANRAITLAREPSTAPILLRPDRAAYRVGETMHLDTFASGSVGTVYLDIIKEGQTVSTRALDAVNGRAAADVDVTTDWIGALQLHAYHVERDGTIVRDTRVVVVQEPSDLKIAIQPDRATYRPGDNSRVSFSVTDPSGRGVQSALGVSAVDESVFALAEQDPGFAKLYFLLQAELLEPKYQVKGFTLPEVVTYKAVPPPPELRTAQDQSARAAWAPATPFDFVLKVNSQPEKVQAANNAQKAGLNNLAGWLAFFLSVMPLAMIGFVLTSLYRKKILGRAVSYWMGALLVYCFASPFLLGFIAFGSVMLVQAQLGVLLVAVTALVWLIALGILIGYAVIRRDEWVQITLLFLIAYLIFLGMLLYVGNRATSFGEWPAFSVIITYLVALTTLVLLGTGLLIQKQTAPGIAAILLAFLFIPATVLLALMPTAGPFLRAMGSPGLYVPPAFLTGCAPAATPVPGSERNALQDFAKGLGTGMMSSREAVAVPTQAAAAPAGKAPESAQAQEAPRLRQYFPETLYFNPQVITDEAGRAELDIPLADSITTWRLGVMASSQRGELGSANAGLRVFQDFFVDLDLPVALTQNDEISVPVAVYNYLPQAQKVKLQIEQQPWFSLQDNAEKTLTIDSNDIDVVYFRIKALNFGMQKLKITALGEKMSDAIQRELRVYPDGKSFDVTQSNWLKGDTTQVVEIPAPAIQGASRIEVKIFPGIVSQAVSGLDGMLKMPFG